MLVLDTWVLIYLFWVIASISILAYIAVKLNKLFGKKSLVRTADTTVIEYNVTIPSDKKLEGITLKSTRRVQPTMV
jgi:Tfp pilus assembly major pilin PilA